MLTTQLFQWAYVVHFSRRLETPSCPDASKQSVFDLRAQKASTLRDPADGSGVMSSPSAQHLIDQYKIAVAEAKRMVKLSKALQLQLQNEGNAADLEGYIHNIQAEHYPHKLTEDIISHATKAVPVLKVGTLNVWLEHDWDSRVKTIVDVLKAEDLDIIALQEIRVHGGVNQAEYIHKQLPDGYHLRYLPCSPQRTETKEDGTVVVTGEEEGLAVLSKLPILSSQSAELPSNPQWSTDTNPRCVLQVDLDSSEHPSLLNKLQVFVSHLSYADTQQCLNFAALRYLVDAERADRSNQLLLGDLNTYFGWEWPLDVLTRPHHELVFSPDHPCFAPQQETQQLTIRRGDQVETVVVPAVTKEVMFASPTQQPDTAFSDAWVAVLGQHKLGFTFSNVWDLGKVWDDNPPARADRILVRGPNLVGRHVHVMSANQGPGTIFDGLRQRQSPQGNANGYSDHHGVVAHFSLLPSKRSKEEHYQLFQTLRQELGSRVVSSPLAVSPADGLEPEIKKSEADGIAAILSSHLSQWWCVEHAGSCELSGGAVLKVFESR